MENTFELNVVSHEGKLFSQKVSFFKCHSSTGEIGVYPEHTDSLIMLESTDLEYELDEDNTKKFFVRSGILSINSGNATIITDQLLFPENIEIDSVKESISTYQGKINASNENNINEKYRKLVLENEAKLRVLN